MPAEINKTWGASRFGKLFTGAPDWQLTMEGEQFTLKVNQSTLAGNVLELSDVTVSRGVIWSALGISRPGGQRISLDGIPNSHAETLRQEIQTVIERIRYQARVAELLRSFKSSIAPVMTWAAQMIQAVIAHRRSQTSPRRAPVSINNLMSTAKRLSLNAEAPSKSCLASLSLSSTRLMGSG